MGHLIEAVTFDSVTIYLSDTVGFTSMSSDSTPYEAKISVLYVFFVIFLSVESSFLGSDIF